MQKFILIGIIVLSVVSIIAGRLYYGERLDTIASNAQEEMAGGASSVEENNETEEIEDTEVGEAEVDPADVNEENNEEAENVSDFTTEELDSLTDGIPEEIAETITTNIQNGDTVSLVTLGTRSSADYYDEGVTPWPELLEEELEEVYGEDVFEMTNINHGEFTSREIVELGRHTSLAEVEADIFLIEGFNWNDNLAVVTPDEAQENMEEMIDMAASENEDMVTVLQPSPPAFGTSIYPEQVAEFEEFAEENYIYINHWEAWPDLDDEELLDYVDEDRMPNQTGHELWSNYIIQTFAAQ